MARAHARARAQGSWSRDQRPDPRRSSAVVATDCFARARVQWDRDTRQEARVSVTGSLSHGHCTECQWHERLIFRSDLSNPFWSLIVHPSQAQAQTQPAPKSITLVFHSPNTPQHQILCNKRANLGLTCFDLPLQLYLPLLTGMISLPHSSCDSASNPLSRTFRRAQTLQNHPQ